MVDVAKNDKCAAVIGVIDKKTKMIETFKPSDGSWGALCDITEEICEKSYCAIAVEEVIIVLARDCSNYKFDLSKPTEGWVALPNRHNSGRIQVVELDGKLYAFHDEALTSSTIEVLDADHSSWTKTKKVMPCQDEAVTAYKGFVYVFGGQDESWLERSSKFDPGAESWIDLPDMSTPRIQAAATALDDKIYVLGSADGQIDLDTVECFDISTQSWSMLRPMNDPHRFFSAFAFDGKVYAVDSYFRAFVVEEYDPATDTWKDVTIVYDTDIPPRATFSICV